jgi:hypothetical protein
MKLQFTIFVLLEMLVRLKRFQTGIQTLNKIGSYSFKPIFITENLRLIIVA